MTIATTQNLTILGILTILGGLLNAATQYIQTKTFDVNALLVTVSAGVGMILAKGAQSTGGTVDAAGKPVVPAPAINVGPKGYARLAVLLLLATGCAGISALSGSTGPIPVTVDKDATGATIPTSTVTITTGPAVLSGDQCLKPLSVSLDWGQGQHDACQATIPLKPVNGACP
jgi:hypothetical protein